MPAPFAIRRLTPADAADYRRIRLAALEHSPEAFGSVLVVEAARPFEHFAEHLATSVVFGAYGEGRIIGMIGLLPDTGPKTAHKAFVWGFYVEPGYRGREIGAALLAALIASARPPIEQLTLTVVPSGHSAIRLYEQAGFTPYGLEPRVLKTDAGYVNMIFMGLQFKS